MTIRAMMVGLAFATVFAAGAHAQSSNADLVKRGEYLVNHVSGCTDCHTPVDPATGGPLMDKYLAGKQPYEGPWGVVYGGNITPDVETGIGSWTDEEVKRALVLDPNLAGAHLLKGNLLLRVGRANDALTEFNEYLRLEPNGPFAGETHTLIEKIKKATTQSHG